MTGDLADIVSRLRAVLPKRWFGEQIPNLSALLQCIATPWVWLYGTIDYVISQTRLITATEDWLDLIAHDYFGSQLVRISGETDVSYRARVQAALQREAATRSAVSSGLEALTGAWPIIFEPANCMDTGSYGVLSGGSITVGTGLAYGLVGGWGSLNMPFQFFVTAIRPPSPGISMLAGYGTPNGGYGEGTISYADLSILPGHVTDENIQATLSSLLPVNAVAWLRIQSIHI
jgi:hypothetical protein